VIVANFDVVCISVDKPKADTPRVVHRDGVLALPVRLSAKVRIMPKCSVSRDGCQTGADASSYFDRRLHG
jgi:hypothetical protein